MKIGKKGDITQKSVGIRIANVSQRWLDVVIPFGDDYRIRLTASEIGKPYKPYNIVGCNNLWVVSMIPGDRKVAGCFNFSENLGGVL